MEGTSVLSLSSSRIYLKFHSFNLSSPSQHPQFLNFQTKHTRKSSFAPKNLFLFSSSSSPSSPSSRSSLLSPVSFVALDKSSSDTSSSSSPPPPPKESLPKIDRSGRFCSPRAARELALSVIYAACLEGCDPVRFFDKRLNFKREPGYEFDKTMLMEYNHMSFSGPPVSTQTEEEEEELLQKDEKESAVEAEVLSAPPKIVYSKLILRLARKMLVAVGDNWDKHVLVIDKIAPPKWKNESVGRILELCILHLAMAEIATLGTRYQIVINEAVDLAKRFCDGTAPRIINGCLRTFVKNHSNANAFPPLEVKS